MAHESFINLIEYLLLIVIIISFFINKLDLNVNIDLKCYLKHDHLKKMQSEITN